MKKKVLSSITLVTLSTLLIAGYASPAFAGHAANPNSATANLGKHQNNGQTKGDKALRFYLARTGKEPVFMMLLVMI